MATNDRTNWRWDAFANELTGVGDSEQDPHQSTRWFSEGSRHYLSEQELDEIYEFSRFARRIVERPARDATRPGVEVRKGDTKERPLKRHLDKKFDISGKLREAHIAARHTGGAAWLLMIDDGNDLDEPVNWKNIKSLNAIHVFDRFDLSPETYVSDLDDPDYGKPETYDFHPESEGADVTDPILGPNGEPINDGADIHADRVVRFVGERVRDSRISSYDGWGQSTIESTYKALKDIGIASEATSSAVHEFQFQILKIAGLHQLLTEVEGGKGMFEDRLTAMKLSKSILNAVALDADRGEDLQQRSVDFSGLKEAWSIIQQVFSAVTGIPLSLAFGLMPSGLSSNDDTGRENYFDDVDDHRDDVYKPAIMRVVEVLLRSDDVEAGLGMLESLNAWFGPLDEKSEVEQAEEFSTYASAISGLVKNRVIGPETAKRLLLAFVDAPIELTSDSETDPDDVDDLDFDEMAAEGFRFDRSTWRPPAEARENARRGLRLRETFGRGGGRRSEKIARKIVGGTVRDETAREIRRFLKAHARNFNPEADQDGGPTNGTITFLLWGGQEALESLEDRFRGDSESEFREDPFSGPGDPKLPDHVQELDKSTREQWVSVWNEVFGRTESEEKAFQAANAAIQTDTADAAE